MPCPASAPTIVSKTTIFPDKKSAIEPLKLSVSDLPMLSCHYIQKGNLFFLNPYHHRQDFSESLIPALKTGLSKALSAFPPLAGRLVTDPAGNVFLSCIDAGADFLHANAATITVQDVISPSDIPNFVKEFFLLDNAVSYEAHFRPILAVQVTELVDGVFIGCTINHAAADGTSFWNFFNTFAAETRGMGKIPPPPYFKRDSVLMTSAVLRFPDGCPKVTFDADAPLRERMFSFSRDSLWKLKTKVNNSKKKEKICNGGGGEICGKQRNDGWRKGCNGVGGERKEKTETSSFQALCALLWRAVTRARKLGWTTTTTFRMAVNCRQRVDPKMGELYFGNAIQSIPTQVTAGKVIARDLGWCAKQLNRNVRAHDDKTIRRLVAEWEANPRCFPLGNFDGTTITMGSSPRFPMYDNDFGWGRPMAVRSGRANKFDGKISAFPGREGGGDVDLEVCLSPQTMARIETDSEFMEFVSD